MIIENGNTFGTNSSVSNADFDVCQTDNCFMMHVSTRQHGMGTTSGGGTQNVHDVTTYISDDSGLTSVQFNLIE